jgi:hypothetical protein
VGGTGDRDTIEHLAEFINRPAAAATDPETDPR